MGDFVYTEGVEILEVFHASTFLVSLEQESLKGIARNEGFVCKKVLCVKGTMSRSIG